MEQFSSMPSTSEASSLPRWVYVILATVTAGIGLAASGVTAQFFVLGLERLEPDPVARSILVATGLLMIATELAAFGVAALLPADTLRGMRRKLIATGVLLLAFEGATIAITQGALDQASEVAASASSQRVQELQASIQARRAAAQSLRENGAKQSASSSAWTRTLGANALRDALKVEGEIEPLAVELTRLQAAARPTTASVLGEQATMAYGLARGLLISTMGLVMFATAGALLREALTQGRLTPAVSGSMPRQALATGVNVATLKPAPVATETPPTSLQADASRHRKDGWRKALQRPRWLVGEPSPST